jgi:ECF transporter S component (folate family)
MQNILKGNKVSTSVMVKASLLAGLSIILTRVFAFMIPLAGLPALRIGFGAIPIIISGILFGPIIGGFTGAVADVVGFLINPMGGAFFPGFTISAALSGAIPGFVYHFIKERNSRFNYNILNGVAIVLFAVSVILVIFSKGVLKFSSGEILYNGSAIPFILPFLYIVLVGLFVSIPFIVTKISEKKAFNDKYSIDKITFIVTINELIISLTLNTFWLSVMFKKGFMVFLPGRILAGFVVIPLHSFILYTLSRLFKYVD